MRLLTSFFIGLLLTACTGGPPPPPPNTGKFAPEVNPYPRYYMYIKGHIDPQFFKDHHKVQFIAEYYTFNDACEYVLDSFEGVSSNREQQLIISPTIDETGEYEIEVPLDKYKNGYCDWNLVNINFLISGGKINAQNAIALFNKDSKNKTYDIHDKMQCNELECGRIVPPYLDSRYLLSTKTNYIFYFDIYWK